MLLREPLDAGGNRISRMYVQHRRGPRPRLGSAS